MDGFEGSHKTACSKANNWMQPPCPGGQLKVLSEGFSTPAMQGLAVNSKQAADELEHAGSFTIPAFKCLTEDDLIMTDELEDGGALAAVFGEMADPSKMGELPTEEDLRLTLFDPTPPPAAPLAPAPYPSLAAAYFDPLLPSLSAPLPQGPFGLSMQQHLSHPKLLSLLPLRQAQQGQLAEQEGGGGDLWEEVESRTPPSRSSSLGSIKRRMDAMDLEDAQGSPSAKRSNSKGVFLARDSTLSHDPALHAVINNHEMHRSASAPYPLSRFSLDTFGSRSLSPSPAPTPVRRAERASPLKAPSRHAVQRSHSMAAAAELSSQGSDAASAQFKGVSRHKLTQRWEASLWLAGRQLYLGGFDNQEDAARAYDIAAMACKGEGADTNFDPSEYAQQLQEVQGLARDEVIAYVRRRSSAFSRGKSRYRGVSGQAGRWEARIGSFQARKNVSFGIFESEEDAARQYDRALILEKGRSAKTNFPIKEYEAEVAEYQAYITSRCGGFGTEEAAEAAQEYTMPPHRTATLEDRKRSALIYAEDLRQKLALNCR